MTLDQMIIREETIVEALRALGEVISDGDVPPIAYKMLDAVKRLRSPKPVVIAAPRVDFMAQIQTQARKAHAARHTTAAVGPMFDATADVKTPLGRLSVTVWRRKWYGVHGARVAWAAEFWLDDQPITIAGMKQGGLAARPKTRNRAKKEAKL